MARRSRRNKQTHPAAASSAVPNHVKEPAAAYVRLSSEESEKDTIETQLQMLRTHIESSGSMYLEDIYIDNGFTGTNFDRPEFTRMITDVRSGKIKCIVVKDLSRFGRNFIETGYYIETILPKLNARLIAVTDDFDSGRQRDQDALSVPVKNLVNEYYAKDYSKKISDMNAARRRSGKYTIERAVYGYCVDKEKDEYYINPETAPVVQMIFRWYLSGIRPGVIAQRLNLLGIITPKEYKSLYETGEEMTASRVWTPAKVITILVRDAYAGDRVLGTRLHALYRNSKFEIIPRENWTIYKDDHDALITREDFQRANEMLQEHVESRRAAVKRNKEVNPQPDNLFANMVYCASCGRKLKIDLKRYRDGTIKSEGATYVCKCRTDQDSRTGCCLGIEVDLLRIIVNDQIRMMIDLMLEQEQIISKLRKDRSEKNPIHKYKMRIDSAAMKAEQCGERIANLYEDLATGLLEKDDYTALKTQYQNERNKYEEEIAENREMLRDAEESMSKLGSIIETLNDRFQNMELDRKLLEYMVEKIVIHADRNVEIVFRFEDVFQRINEIIEGGEGS